MDNVLDYVFKNRKRILRVVILLIIVIVLIVIASAGYLITIDDGVSQPGKAGNTPGTVKETMEESIFGGNTDSNDINTKVSINGGYALDVDMDEIVDTIIAELNKNDSRLGAYISGGKQHEYLKKMITAEYITQYPDLRVENKIGTPIPANEFQGIIKFRRHKSDGTEQLLQYIPLGPEDSTDSNTLNGLIYLANIGVPDAKNKVLNRFSIDTKGNLVIANWTETISKSASGEYDTEYKSDDEETNYYDTDKAYLDSATEEITYIYSTYSISYKSIISKYTMPFNYLWAFLVCGHDEEFVRDLADLVLDSSIEIGIYDNLTEIEETNISGYNSNLWQATRRHLKVEQKRTVTATGRTTTSTNTTDGDWSDVELTKTTHNYDANYSKTYSNSVVVAATDVDAWCLKYKANYTYEVEDAEEQKETTKTPGDELGDPSVLTSGMTYNYGSIWNEINKTNNPLIDHGTIIGSIVTTTSEKIDYATQNQKNQITFTTVFHPTRYNYTLDGDPEVLEKTDKTLKTGDEGYPNFCTLYVNSFSAKGNITGIESWLFEILERNIDTVNMVELTKYMLYMATGTNYGVTSFDFTSIYTSTGRSNFTGGTVEAKVWFAMIDAGYSPEAVAGAMGNFQRESGFFTNNLWNDAEAILGMNDEEYTIAVDNGTYTNFITDNYAYGLAQWKGDRKRRLYELAQSKGVSVSDADMQIEYLFDEINPTGPNFQMGSTINGFTYSDWVNAATPEKAAEVWCWLFERPGGFDSKRADAAREIYDRYKDLERSTFVANPNVSTDGYSGVYTSSSGKLYYEYKQYLGSWKDKPYANGTMSNKGCYCTATAIITSSFNPNVTPEDIRATKNSSGLASADSFFNNNGISSIGKEGVTKDEIAEHLSQGYAVMIHVDSTSSYTNNEHWMALVDIDGDSVYVSNPSSTNKTGWRSLTEVMKGLDRAIFTY